MRFHLFLPQRLSNYDGVYFCAFAMTRRGLPPSPHTMNETSSDHRALYCHLKSNRLGSDTPRAKAQGF